LNGYGLALAALALVVFGAYGSYPSRKIYLLGNRFRRSVYIKNVRLKIKADIQFFGRTTTKKERN